MDKRTMLPALPWFWMRKPNNLSGYFLEKYWNKITTWNFKKHVMIDLISSSSMMASRLLRARVFKAGPGTSASLGLILVGAEITVAGTRTDPPCLPNLSLLLIRSRFTVKICSQIMVLYSSHYLRLLLEISVSASCV